MTEILSVPCQAFPQNHHRNEKYQHYRNYNRQRRLKNWSSDNNSTDTSLKLQLKPQRQTNPTSQSNNTNSSGKNRKRYYRDKNKNYTLQKTQWSSGELLGLNLTGSWRRNNPVWRNVHNESPINDNNTFPPLSGQQKHGDRNKHYKASEPVHQGTEMKTGVIAGDFDEQLAHHVDQLTRTAMTIAMTIAITTAAVTASTCLSGAIQTGNNDEEVR